MSTHYKPPYRVIRNHALRFYAVCEGKEITEILSTKHGSKTFYFHMQSGKQSKLYPTQRDCINNIVYGV